MTLSRYALIGVALLLVVVVYITFFTGGGDTVAVSPEAYRQQVLAERQKKDDFCRTSPDSPIPDKAHFTGLAYYDPNLTYRVTARLDPFADKTQKLIVRLSDGSEDVYEKYAHVVFSLADTPCRLLVLKHEGTLSILYKDATSGGETYGGGRYIDLDPETIVENRVVVDFNAGYNPYCAYAPEYACPLPPPENTLPIAVKAGEKYAAHE
ncbi:MAG: DUF1684 domain-containing protein [Bacteroidetes bacterium]|nr:DUF1684 domain-containing protein [Fibrella sp.]